MPASESQLTYEEVFRDFVKRALSEERKQCTVTLNADLPPWTGQHSESTGARDVPDAASGTADGPSEQRVTFGRGRGRGRPRGRGRGRGLSDPNRHEVDAAPPPAKRARGRGRDQSRGRSITARAPAETVDDVGEPAASGEPEWEVTEKFGDGRRRSSRRSRARTVDFSCLLDDEDEDDEDEDDDNGVDKGEDDKDEEDKDYPRTVTGAADEPNSADESADDWRPPEHEGGSSEEGSCAALPPRRGRPAGGGGGRVTRRQLPEELAVKVNTPPANSDRPPDAALKTGDFLISVDDINLDKPPIWRIDGKFLIQKYEPIKGNGQRLYKNMATYMSWSANTDRFRPVSVRYHQMGRTEVIVELLDNPHSSTFNRFKMLSIEATSKYLENFEIYMQTLISQALDPNFLMEITQEEDEYFMKNVNVVQETNLARKNKLLELKSWNDATQAELDTLPVLELVLLRNVPPSECAVCHQTANARLVQLYGRPYDPTTLLTRHSDTPAAKRQRNMCSFCAGLADLYNKVQHLTYHLYLRCCEKVSLRKEAADNDSTRILNDILAEEAWLSKAFSDVQQIWGDVDQIYTAAKEERFQQTAQSTPADGAT